MSTDRLAALLEEYAELEKRMADPSIHADQARPAGSAAASPSWRRSTRPRNELEAARADLAAARELAAEDPSFAGGGRGAGRRACRALEEKLGEMLVAARPATTPRT